MRLWWNRQTRYFEVVVEKSVLVQVQSGAPLVFNNFDDLKNCSVVSSLSTGSIKGRHNE